MSNAYIVSIRLHNDPVRTERERWHVLATDDQEAIYRVWRSTPTSHFDEIKIIGTLPHPEAERLGLKLNEPVRVKQAVI